MIFSIIAAIAFVEFVRGLWEFLKDLAYRKKENKRIYSQEFPDIL